MQQKIEELEKQAKMVHEQLDEAIDGIKSKIVDLQVEVDYDVKRLSEKFEGGVPPVSELMPPCAFRPRQFVNFVLINLMRFCRFPVGREMP